MTNVSKSCSEKVFMTPKDIALAPDRIASLILLNKILTSYNFLLPKCYSHWSSSFVLTILANTNPKASAAPNKACKLTQKYLAMKILSLSCNNTT